ncbi:MAG: hypothetical protein KGV43_03645 [Arcobacter sp.]|nr:hypothetical protein [Arcobacter sp.]
MKEILKKITDLTINDILQQEVILPSSYLKSFNTRAKELEINVEDEDFKKEIDDIIVNELKNIENYMKNIEENIETMEEITKKNKEAILENKDGNFDSILKDINKLEKNMKNLNDKMYKDEIFQTYNRKWIYNKFLDKNNKFRTDGICVLIDIVDFEYIKKEYGNVLASNYIIYIINFIEKQLTKMAIEYKIAKYVEDKFLIFIDSKYKKEIEGAFYNLKKALLSTTLKSKSGVLIHSNLDYFYDSYNEKQNAQEFFEDIFFQIRNKE